MPVLAEPGRIPRQPDRSRRQKGGPADLHPVPQWIQFRRQKTDSGIGKNGDELISLFEIGAIVEEKEMN